MKPVATNPEMEVVPSSRSNGARREPDPAEVPGLAKARLLWRHRRVLARAAVWGLLAATVIAFLIPKQYESTTRLMPPDDQSGAGMALMATLSGKLSGGLGSLAGDVLGMKSSGDLFIGILGSRTVKDDLITKFDLRKAYWESSWEASRRILGSKTSIGDDRKSGIITIVVTDRNPQRAAAMAREYVAELNSVVSELSTSSAHRERVFLEDRLTQVKQDLEASETAFSDFASKTGAIDVKEQGKAMVTAAATLQGQLIAAQSELEGLKQIYADNNVRVRSLRARVSELQSQLEKLGGKDDAMDDASTETNSSYPSLRELPRLGVSYADLYRRTKVEEAVFETLTQEYELAKVAEAKSTPSVKVLDPAEVPEKKSFPPRLTVIFLGTALCFIFTGLWILARTHWDEMDAQDARKDFAQEVFHTINAGMPWSPPNGSRFQAASHRLWIRAMARNSHASDIVDVHRGEL